MNSKKDTISRIAKEEEKILEFWKQKDIFQKTIDKPNPYGEYVFYDGPPFATGLPHYGHILVSAIKDAIPRYQTMRGKLVHRRWGWDCHGLPIENIVEKELKISGKKQILEMGIAKFNAKARESVLTYVAEWKKTVERIGRWVDFDNAYMTMDDTYIESVWWALKEIYKKGLLYEGVKVLAYCPRCETPIANAEIAMDNSYKDIKDISIYANFALKDEKDTYLVAWTTTPWTLPANTALAVNSNAEYVVVTRNNSKGNYIVAKELLTHISEVLGETLKIEKTLKGKALVGKFYKPLFDYYAFQDLPYKDNGWKVYAGDFVTMAEGTGVVHIAPGFGEDDKTLSEKENLPLINHVTYDGKFADEFGDAGVSFKGIPVKAKENPPAGGEQSDVAILKYLAPRGGIFAKKNITHSYPHCYRCETPLFYYALPSWFINIQKVKKQLLKNNNAVNWFPEHLKHGRFGKTIEFAPDWTISRNRFWASPLPIWKCDSCEEIEVIGSREELFARAPEWKNKLTDLHRPFIDEVIFPCVQCKKTMKRTPEVIDGWVESGAMPFASLHYPFENKKWFKDNFPAQFISEYIAQTRTWFYYTHALSTILFGKHAYENVLTTGTILAEDGEKMAKSKKNFPDPWLMFDTYGVDAMRLYLLGSQVMRGEDLHFVEEGVSEMLKKVILVCENSLEFYNLYKGNFKPEGTMIFDVEHPLDRWLISLHDKTIREVTTSMEAYDIAKAVRALEDFIRELSQWYIRRSRDRFKGEDVLDKEQAIAVFGETLLSIAKCLAPIAPFLAERMYNDIFSGKGPFESVHLDEWPKSLKSGEYDKDNRDMTIVRDAVELIHSIRSDEKLKVRQPLSEMQVFVDQKPWSTTEAFESILLSEVNVQKLQTYDSLDDFDGNKIIKKASGAITVLLNIEITEELKREGWIRELTRQINSYRKKEGLTIHDNVVFTLSTDSRVLTSVIDEFKNELEKSVLGTIEMGERGGSQELFIEDTKVTISYTK